MNIHEHRLDIHLSDGTRVHWHNYIHEPDCECASADRSAASSGPTMMMQHQQKPVMQRMRGYLKPAGSIGAQLHEECVMRSPCQMFGDHVAQLRLAC